MIGYIVYVLRTLTPFNALDATRDLRVPAFLKWICGVVVVLTYLLFYALVFLFVLGSVEEPV